MSNSIRKITFPVNIKDEIFLNIEDRYGILKINNIERFKLENNQLTINGLNAGIITDNVGITIKSDNTKISDTIGIIPYRDLMQFVIYSDSENNEYLEINENKFIFLGKSTLQNMTDISQYIKYSILPRNQVFFVPDPIEFSNNIQLLSDKNLFFYKNNNYTVSFSFGYFQINENVHNVSQNLHMTIYKDIEIWLYGLDTKEMIIGGETIPENKFEFQDIII